MLKNGVPGAPGVSEVPKTLKSSGFCLDLVWIWPLLESFLDTFSAFFFQGLRDAKKGGPGARSKIVLFFFWISGSPRRASGGFPSRRELTFHFYSRSQKGLQNESPNGAFGAPKSQLYSLWSILFTLRGDPEIHKKRGQVLNALPDPLF